MYPAALPQAYAEAADQGSQTAAGFGVIPTMPGRPSTVATGGCSPLGRGGPTQSCIHPQRSISVSRTTSLTEAAGLSTPRPPSWRVLRRVFLVGYPAGRSGAFSRERREFIAEVPAMRTRLGLVEEYRSGVGRVPPSSDGRGARCHASVAPNRIAVQVVPPADPPGGPGRGRTYAR